MRKIAIDVGGVLIEKKDKRLSGTNFDIDDIKWMPEALESIKLLSQHFDLYILSFCGKKTEIETRFALRKEIINYIPEDKWIFTREASYKVFEMKKRNINTIVDDTWQVISWVVSAGLEGVHYGSYIFPDWKHITNYLVEKYVNIQQA